jgi:hypothetical protein
MSEDLQTLDRTRTANWGRPSLGQFHVAAVTRALRLAPSLDAPPPPQVGVRARETILFRRVGVAFQRRAIDGDLTPFPLQFYDGPTQPNA